MKKVKITDQNSPLFGKIGVVMENLNATHHSVIIDGQAYNFNRLAFKYINVHTPAIQSEKLQRIAVSIERLYNELEGMDILSKDSNTDYARGYNSATKKALLGLKLILEGK